MFNSKKNNNNNNKQHLFCPLVPRPQRLTLVVHDDDGGPGMVLASAVGSLRFPTGGSKTYIPKIFYKTGGQKRIYQKISIRKLHTLRY
ncbi:hypothetical protein HanIR_Chr15g0743101 [Helianthus annuus]|nr:hypothetical protein HanIR_Chr15g0743101 [Helianthus annuus]